MKFPLSVLICQRVTLANILIATITFEAAFVGLFNVSSTTFFVSEQGCKPIPRMQSVLEREYPYLNRA